MIDRKLAIDVADGAAQLTGMTTRRFVLPASICWCAAACTTSESIDPQPPGGCAAPNIATAGWVTVRPGKFVMQHPPGFQPVAVHGIDSNVGMFRGADDNAQVTYDLGWYSNDLSADSTIFAEYQRCAAEIGGRTATVVTGTLRDAPDGRRFVAAAAWRNIDNSAQPVHLTVWNTARDAATRDTLAAVLQTVRFE